ncbi:MAG: tetratricopeptide repeat protein [Holophagales bacterium]|nr:tetratricopeptide repeat protein [Holophagales bacterium]
MPDTFLASPSNRNRAGSRPRNGGTLGPGALALAVLVGAPSLVAGAAGQKTDPAGTQAPAGASEKGRGTRTGSEWFDRGMELHESERWDAAIDAFRKALEAGYREEVAAYNIACAQARKGDEDLAFQWLDKAMQGGFDVYGYLDDSDLDSLHSDPRWTELKKKAREAKAGRDQAKTRRAAERFDLLVARTPRDGRALYDVGRELLRTADYDRAARAFVAAAETGVREGTSLYNAACARALAGQKPEALDLLQRALDSGFDDPDQLREDDDLDSLRAEPRFRQLVTDAEELTRDGFPSLGARLLRSQMVAEGEEAATRFEGYLKRHPGSGRGWSNLGYASLAAENDRQAVRAFRKALELGYRRPATQYNLACAHARLKEKDEAFAWLDKAIDAGFHSDHQIENDDDLFNLRRDPRFAKAVARARKASGGIPDEP